MTCSVDSVTTWRIRHTYDDDYAMVRIKVPQDNLSIPIEKIAQLSEMYSIGSAFSTRENIQLHWVILDVSEIMQSFDVGMTSRDMWKL